MKSILTLVGLITLSGFIMNTIPTMKSIAQKDSNKAESTIEVDTIEAKDKKNKPLKTAKNEPNTKTKPTKSKTPAPKPKPPKTPTTPKPTPTPKYTSQGSCELAHNFNWPSNIAAAICMAESSGVANKTNWADNHGSCSGSYGLMQNACFWFPYFGYSLAQAHDPLVSMTVAYKIYQRQGNFNAWTTYTKGLYLRYL